METKTKTYPIVNDCRGSDITRKVKTLDIDLRVDPNSPWNTSTYVPLSMVKLLIAKTFSNLQQIQTLSLETIACLQSVLDLEDFEKKDM